MVEGEGKSGWRRGRVREWVVEGEGTSGWRRGEGKRVGG